jgi:2-C-methyl-D-erythritol 4-phosphate cytidylyltransferase / 2-C-methyl-D-erythritol 2,4-cyclodiphosphate synthase
MWSLAALAKFGCAPLVVVVPEPNLDATIDLTAAFTDVTVVPGGDTRQESVAHGLERVTATRVVVHDAARPFLSRDLLRRVVEGIGDGDGAIAAEPVEETIKAVDGARVVETVDRARLWRAQTPQAFVTESLRRAHERAPDDAATDDAQLVELAGGTITVVRGDRRNIKITFDEDFEVAEALAARIE